MSNYDSNLLIAQTFANQFDPPLSIVHTERMNEIPSPDAFCISYWDQARKIGISAFVFGEGHFKAYLEAAGKGDIAEDAGCVFAKALNQTEAR